MNGKNFSCNNVKGTRKKSDFYQTPYKITSRMLDAIGEDGLPKHYSILEPAAQGGAILKVLSEYGYTNVTGKDIVTGDNFLNEEEMSYDVIFTNPPFSLADDFILKAKRVARHKIIMLLPLSYLHGKYRYDNIWNVPSDMFPLESVYVFTRYPMLGEPLREDGKYNTGMMVYAWYVWSRKIGDGTISSRNIEAVASEQQRLNGSPFQSYSPSIRWIDNDSDIVRK